MAYQPAIPQPTDVFPTSQGDILHNFTQLDAQFKVEHDALTAPADGLHKYVTLQQSTPLPAPAGTNAQISQQVTGAFGSPYFEYKDSTGVQSVCLTRTYNNVNVLKSSAGNFFNFNVMPPSMGYVFISDNAQPARTLMSPFIYKGGVLNIPVGDYGTSHFGQLPSGKDLQNFIGAGTWLQVNSPNAVFTVTLQIMYCPL